MFIKSLYELYNRLVAQGVEIPRYGVSLQNVSFRVIIKENGDFVRIEDARTLTHKIGKNGKPCKPTAKHTPTIVLGQAKQSGKVIDPCFLWDNAEYALGIGAKDDKNDRFFATRDKYLSFEERVNNKRFSAVCRFYEKWNPKKDAAEWEDEKFLENFGVFRILGEEIDIHEDEQIRKWWMNGGAEKWKTKKETPIYGRCLVTGEYGEIARLHEPKIKGVAKAQSSGATLVSFNSETVEHFGKTQGENAPIAKKVAFGYCTALNYLLANKKNRLPIGGTTAVFWTDSPNSEEDELLIRSALGFYDTDAMDEALVQRVHDRLDDIVHGRDVSDYIENADNVPFYILGLAPNAARLFVRYYHESTLGDFVRNVKSHYDAMRLQTRTNGNFSGSASPYRIMLETISEKANKDKIPNVQINALYSSILNGTRYPDSVAFNIINRIKVEKNVNDVKCSFLKAWLIRNKHKQIKSMLDEENKNTGYVLGRLFAALAKTQEDAIVGAKDTMRNSYYGAACTNPASVFPLLLKRYNTAYINKLNGGLKVVRDKLVLSLTGSMEKLPKTLSVEQQAEFAVGFAQQYQSFFQKKVN